MEYTERDLNLLIEKAILECDSLPYLCHFAKTEAGKRRILKRIKEHIFIRGIDDIDTAMALIESELETPLVEQHNL